MVYSFFEDEGGCHDHNRPVACKGSRMQLFLIAVTSRLDAVVACINVLHPMENQ